MSTEPDPDLVAEIRVAYLGAVGRPHEWASVREVRRRINGPWERAEVDATLIAVSHNPYIHLAPQADQKQLTPADREADVLIGGSPTTCCSWSRTSGPAGMRSEDQARRISCELSQGAATVVLRR